MNIISYFFVLFLFFFNTCYSSFYKDMMFIPKGEYIPMFKTVSLDNGLIEVNNFYLDKFHATNYDFLFFILNNPKADVCNIKSIFSDDSYLNHWIESIDFIDLLYKPVVNVSWFYSNDFCNFYLSRLPTLDEWEYTANLNKNTLYLSNIISWYINSQNLDLLDVYNMSENFFGIYGMHGFIWEWVSDFNSVILINVDAEGGGLEELLYCGASTINAIDPSDYISFMRYAFRNSLESTYAINKLGVRCAKSFN